MTAKTHLNMHFPTSACPKFFSFKEFTQNTTCLPPLGDESFREVEVRRLGKIDCSLKSLMGDQVGFKGFWMVVSVLRLHEKRRRCGIVAAAVKWAWNEHLRLQASSYSSHLSVAHYHEAGKDLLRLRRGLVLTVCWLTRAVHDGCASDTMHTTVSSGLKAKSLESDCATSNSSG